MALKLFLCVFKKILLTGSNGFLGEEIFNELKQEYEFILLDKDDNQFVSSTALALHIFFLVVLQLIFVYKWEEARKAWLFLLKIFLYVFFFEIKILPFVHYADNRVRTFLELN